MITLARLAWLAWPALAAAGAIAPTPVARRAGTAPSPWVTVNKGGVATTITPTVSGTKTISGPPSSLTQTVTYERIVSGTTTTTSGTPPVATGTYKDYVGAFLVCSNYQGVNAPFCLPAAGSEIGLDATYWITWDTSSFADNTTVQVQVNFTNSDNLTSLTQPASDGYVGLPLSSSFLSRRNVDSLNATIYLVTIADSASSDTSYTYEGPNVLITKNANNGLTTSKHHSSHVPAAAIAVPVVLGLAVVASAAFFVWWRFGRRRREQQQQQQQQQQWPPYPPPYQQNPDVGTGVGAGAVPLADRDSWSTPKPGTNVFREELRRQEEATRR